VIRDKKEAPIPEAYRKVVTTVLGSDRLSRRNDLICAAVQTAASLNNKMQRINKEGFRKLLLLVFGIFMMFDPINTNAAPMSGSQFSAGPITTPEHHEVVDKIDLILLHRISKGELQTTVLTREDLRKTTSVNIDGYVSGIVALCREEMIISAANRKMNRIRKNPDGSISLQYYGRTMPTELIHLDSNTPSYAKHAAQIEIDRFGTNLAACGYSLFPRIKGDSVSSNDRFLLSFEWRDQSFQIPIQQSGFCSLESSCASPQYPEGFTFRYIGDRLEFLTQQSADLEERIRAIMRGAGSVEELFDAHLVNQVTILDYEGIRNAVVSEEIEGIWIYIRTLQEESLAELETIAEHEALHRFVEVRKLSKDTKVRQLFADLKGYTPLSSERFFLMMGRDAVQEKVVREGAPPLFFAFIDEKNFLADGKGGHSHENVSEFCASFLHSLMSIDRLKQNLDRPVRLSAGTAQVHHLNWQKKNLLLDHYLRAIEVFTRSVAKHGKVPALLVESLEKVQQLKNAGRNTRI
jgi:hypothetical protein